MSRRASYTTTKKLAIIDRMNNGESMHQLERELNITRRTLRGWRDNAAKLQAAKRGIRKVHPGKPPAYPELDKMLYEWAKHRRCILKQPIGYRSIRRMLNEWQRDGKVGMEFKGSNRWIEVWMRRNKLSVRRITHRAQDKKPSPKLKMEVCSALENFRSYVAEHKLPAKMIFNMDEVPCYIDVVQDRTIHFKGDKSVEIAHTGHCKTRYTVVLTAAADGAMLKAMVIFKGRITVPKVKAPPNVFVSACKSGTMSAERMNDWAASVWRQRGKFFPGAKSLLIVDKAAAHTGSAFATKMHNEFHTSVQFIPAGATYLAQPLDVGINFQFKNCLKEQYEMWWDDPENVVTLPSGNRQRPQYQQIVDMVSKSLAKIDPDSIRKSFVRCGISADGKVPMEQLNEKLAQLLTTEQFENDDFPADDCDDSYNEEFEVVFDDELEEEEEEF